MKISDTMRDAITGAPWVEARMTWRATGRKSTIAALYRRGLSDAAGYLTDAGKDVRVAEGMKDDGTVILAEDELTTGDRVELVGKWGETATGTVTEVTVKRVAKRGGGGSGMHDGDRNGIDTVAVNVYTVQWDGIDTPGEGYRSEELRKVGTVVENVTPDHTVWGHDGMGWHMIGTSYTGQSHAEFLARDARESGKYAPVVVTDGEAQPQETYDRIMGWLRAGAVAPAETETDDPTRITMGDALYVGPAIPKGTGMYYSARAGRTARAAKVAEMRGRTRGEVMRAVRELLATLNDPNTPLPGADRTRASLAAEKPESGVTAALRPLLRF